MKLNRNVTYDMSERTIIRKERIVREVNTSIERDQFHCPIGTIYYYEDVPPYYFGVSVKEASVSKKANRKANPWSQRFYGDEV